MIVLKDGRKTYTFYGVGNYLVSDYNASLIYENGSYFLLYDDGKQEVILPFASLEKGNNLILFIEPISLIKK